VTLRVFDSKHIGRAIEGSEIRQHLKSQVSRRRVIYVSVFRTFVGI
jgi:hypothetical protein